MHMQVRVKVTSMQSNIFTYSFYSSRFRLRSLHLPKLDRARTIQFSTSLLALVALLNLPTEKTEPLGQRLPIGLIDIAFATTTGIVHTKLGITC